MNIWVGTSGYSYADWVGPFYPPGTPSSRMLAHYVHHFPLVELNFTFYRPPTPAVLARLGDKVPPGFGFLVKVPRTISHEERADDLPTFRQSVAELRRRGQLLGLLCQLPQAHHQTAARRAWLERLGGELGEDGLAVEFRHRSWAGPAVAEWLGRHRIDLVAVDAPALPALYPSGLVQSTNRIYVRFHSRIAANWYLSDKERYDYSYSDAELREWAEEVTARRGGTSDAFLLFNNCHRSQAVDNARRIVELFRQRASADVTVVGAFGAASGPVQRSLFGDGGE